MSKEIVKNNDDPLVQEKTVNHNSVSYQIVKFPVITEKTYHLTKNNQYTFVVSNEVNKIEIKKAIESLYSIEVDSVNIIIFKPKNTFVRGKKGKTSKYKKAIVSLKPGFSINI